jgi:RNA ligase (TIGR02306 family)
MDLSREGKYWEVVDRYYLSEKIPNEGFTDIVIQGELAGPGIQKNRLNLTEFEIFVFNVFFIKEHRYAGLEEMATICNRLGLKTVPIEEVCQFDFSVADLLEKAKGIYAGTKNRKEGIVVRPTTPVRLREEGGILSVKAINNDFLLKDEE